MADDDKKEEKPKEEGTLSLLALPETLKDRLNNSIVGSFAISWVLLQWRVWLIMLSPSIPVDDKIWRVTELLNPCVDFSHFAHLVLMPFVAVLAWVFIIPKLSSSAYLHVRAIEIDRDNKASEKFKTRYPDMEKFNKLSEEYIALLKREKESALVLQAEKDKARDAMEGLEKVHMGKETFVNAQLMAKTEELSKANSLHNINSKRIEDLENQYKDTYPTMDAIRKYGDPSKLSVYSKEIAECKKEIEGKTNKPLHMVIMEALSNSTDENRKKNLLLVEYLKQHGFIEEMGDVLIVTYKGAMALVQMSVNSDK